MKLKTNLIEVTVRGQTGCGKSEVLEVIKNALAAFYAYPATISRIAGEIPDGAIDEATTTGQTAKRRNTVFVLYEENVPITPSAAKGESHE